MNRYYFLSDLHIKADQKLKQEALLRFLDSVEVDSTIYFVGDIFDFWIGGLGEYFGDFISKLTLRLKRFDAYFIEGNRDFLFRDECINIGIKPLGWSAKLRIGGLSIFVCHGDLHISHEVVHRGYSAFIRSYSSRFLAGVLPRFVIKQIASRLRKNSKGNYFDKIEPVIGAYIKYLGSYDVIISGHYHLNKIDYLNYKGNAKRVVFLGEQTEHKLDYLVCYERSGAVEFHLKSFV